MPGYDGSGPMGYGAETGKGSGFCRENQGSGSMSMPGWGRGRGRGRQRGFGRGMGMGQQPTRQEERSFLENQAEMLQSRLDAVKEQLDKLETEQAQDI